MGVLSPEHLLEQAERLVAPPLAGAPRQVDVRRAVSSAYYAVFHFTCTETADSFVGKGRRNTQAYRLAYRNIDHQRLRDLCREVAKTSLSTRLRSYQPNGGFGSDLKLFARAVSDLQAKRHSADYDPGSLVRTAEAKVALATAKSGLQHFRSASEEERTVFLAMLSFNVR